MASTSTAPAPAAAPAGIPNVLSALLGPEKMALLGEFARYFDLRESIDMLAVDRELSGTRVQALLFGMKEKTGRQNLLRLLGKMRLCEDRDYITETVSAKTKPIKEVYLTPKTFKSLVMAAETTAGAAVREYYLRLEMAVAAYLRAQLEHSKMAVDDATTRADEATARADDATTRADKAAASAAEFEKMAKAVAEQIEREPLGVTRAHVPPSADSNCNDNSVFRGLTRAFPYWWAGILYYGPEIRAAGAYTAMIEAVTNVHVTLPGSKVSIVTAGTYIQRAIKERMRLWTGTAPEYSTLMTTRQLYTFCVNLRDYLERRRDTQLPQANLHGGVVEEDDSDIQEVSEVVERIEGLFPGIAPLDMGTRVSLDEPLAARTPLLPGQAKISFVAEENALRFTAKQVKRGAGPARQVQVTVADCSDSEEDPENTMMDA